MTKPQVTNRKGPDCELTVRIKFADLDRFRTDYRGQIEQGSYFIKSKRSKPIGTRLQLIFVVEDQDNMEIWSWGAVEDIISPDDVIGTDDPPGLRIKLMDITGPRRKQIEQLFGLDEAVAAIMQRHQESKEQDAGYTQVSRSARQEQIAGLDTFIKMAQTADHYVLLGIAKDADEREVRSAYRDRTRKYHPDQHFRKIPEEMQKELEEVFQKIQEAYRTLSDTSRRATYDTAIGNYANPEAQRRAMPHVRLQEKFKELYKDLIGPRAQLIKKLIDQANDAVAVEDYRGARSKFKLASAYDPLNRKLKQRIKEIEELMPDE
jgi:hypothetical protein